jgi:hypothetical protein
VAAAARAAPGGARLGAAARRAQAGEPEASGRGAGGQAATARRGRARGCSGSGAVRVGGRGSAQWWLARAERAASGVCRRAAP